MRGVKAAPLLPMKQLLDHCEAHLADIVQAIETLVRLESPSTDKAGVDRGAAVLAGRLRAAGAEVEELVQAARGNHLRARIPGVGRPVMLLGHFDTVWPTGTLERMPLHRHGDRLHGPGTFDMKGGIAIALGAIGALRATGIPHAPITMIWTADEEIGSATSRQTIESEARRSAAVLVLEPALPGGALKTARKGCGEYELIVHGVAAHAGLDPGKGASAIHELAAQIAAIERFQALPRGITVNVGIVSGGTRPNVVARASSATTFGRVPPETMPTFTVMPRGRSWNRSIAAIWAASSWMALAPLPGSSPAWAATPCTISSYSPHPLRAVFSAPPGSAGSSTRTAADRRASDSIVWRDVALPISSSAVQIIVMGA